MIGLILSLSLFIYAHIYLAAHNTLQKQQQQQQQQQKKVDERRSKQLAQGSAVSAVLQSASGVGLPPNLHYLCSSRMSSVSHIREACLTDARVMSHTHTPVMSHTHTSHVSHINKSCLT